MQKYHSIHLEQLENLAQEGLGDEEISRRLHIGRSTFYRYKKTFPDFAAALERGRARKDSAVEQALFKKATGYVQRIVKPVKVKEIEYENGKKVRESERLELVEEEQYFPPDTNSALFWLKNRCPEKWQDRQEPTEEDVLDRMTPEAAVESMRRSIAQISKSIG